MGTASKYYPDGSMSESKNENKLAGEQAS
jgi:hypothetical protein